MKNEKVIGIFVVATALIVVFIVVNTISLYFVYSCTHSWVGDVKSRLRTYIDTLLKCPEIWNFTFFGCVHWAQDKARELSLIHI